MTDLNIFVKLGILVAVMAIVGSYTKGLLRLHDEKLINMPVVFLVAVGGAVGGYFLYGPVIATLTGIGTLNVLHLGSVAYHGARETEAWKAMAAKQLKLSHETMYISFIKEMDKKHTQLLNKK